MSVLFARGSVVYVEGVLDEFGKNPKTRQVVFVADFEDSHDAALAVAITSEFRQPLKADEILLPFHRNGGCGSGLTLQSVAVCRWTVFALKQDIREKTGHIPNRQMLAILERVEARMQ